MFYLFSRLKLTHKKVPHCFRWNRFPGEEGASLVWLEEGSRWVYEYDSLGQLTSGKKFFDDWTPMPGQQFEYGFDHIGNRLSSKDGGDEYGAGLRTQTYTNNTLNQIMSRTVPNEIDVIGEAAPQAIVTVNNSSSGVFRKGLYFRKAHTVTNYTFPTIEVRATNALGTNLVSGEVFIPPSPKLSATTLMGT